MDSNGFLDQVKKRRGLDTDNKLSKHLGIPSGTIAGIRAGRRHLTDLEAFKVASDLDLPNGYVMCEIQAARAKDPKAKKLWSVMATQFSGMADFAKKGSAAGLALLLTVGTFCQPSPAQAVDLLSDSGKGDRTMYIMLSN